MLTYYTLEEATQILGTTPEQVKKLLEDHKIRQYRDGRGKVRYVATAVNELARTLGRGSDMELQLGESRSPSGGAASSTGKTPPPTKTPTPTKTAPPPKAPATSLGDPDVFDFTLDPTGSDQVDIGQESLAEPGSSSGRSGKSTKTPSSGNLKSGRSSSKLSGNPPSPPPMRPGSDSDVRLVADGSDLDFQIASDSDVKMIDGPPPSPSPSGRRKSASIPNAPQGDSGVRIIPLETGTDSDVKMVHDLLGESHGIGDQPIKTASDSDIRLDPMLGPMGALHPDEGSDDSMVTEEIDLDAEQRKAEEAAKSKHRQPKVRPKHTQQQLPKVSPFELAEGDIEDPAQRSAHPRSLATDSSSSLELPAAAKPGSRSSSDAGSEKAARQSPADDEIVLGELTKAGTDSGINLQSPADSGISLEQSGSGEIEFELSPDEQLATPKPIAAAAGGTEESSSDFELSLDSSPADEVSVPSEKDDSSSDFELSLDSSLTGEGSSPVAEAAVQDSSDFELSLDEGEGGSSIEMLLPDESGGSEFELTLDDSGGLVPLEEGSSETEATSAEEKDIFETDFEVPPLEEESGSEAVALDDSDTDLESSEFDLALGEEDIAAEDESGSQVVALEDEEAADESAETVARRRPATKRAALEDEEVDDLLGAEDEEVAADEEGAVRPATRAVAAVAAPPWGVFPVIILFPCVLVMFLLGIMGFELVRGMYGFQQPSRMTGFLIDSISRQFIDDLPPPEK